MEACRTREQEIEADETETKRTDKHQSINQSINAFGRIGKVPAEEGVGRK